MKSTRKTESVIPERKLKMNLEVGASVSNLLKVPNKALPPISDISEVVMVTIFRIPTC